MRDHIDRCKWIKECIDANRNHWNLLSDSDLRLYQDYCSGALHDELNAVKEIPIGTAFPGAASNIMSAGQPNCFNDDVLTMMC